MATKTDEITNSLDIIDSRNIIARIEELEGMEKALSLEGNPMDEEDAEELTKLKALTEEADSSEWECGVTLISEDYFEEYAQDFAEDIGAIEKGGQWPTNHIDWERAANQLKGDYSEVDFDGVTYYYR